MTLPANFSSLSEFPEERDETEYYSTIIFLIPYVLSLLLFTIFIILGYVKKVPLD
jgi:hypothetical protein